MSNQISNGVIGTKENPLFITSEEELNQIKPGTRIKFICKSCRQESEREQRKATHKLLLCKQCKIKEFNMNHYGVESSWQRSDLKDKFLAGAHHKKSKPIKRIETKEIIEIKNIDELKNIKEIYHEHTRVKFICECGAIVEKYLRSTSELKCKTCLYKKSMIETHGYISPFSRKDVQEKCKEETLKNYGVDNIFKLPQFRADNNKLYYFEGIPFDSKWEIYFYAFLRDHNKKFEYHPKERFIYFKDGKKHEYRPDFKVEDKFIEIKGGQFFNDRGEPFSPYDNNFWWEKYNCMKENGVNIISEKEIMPYRRYFYSKYGKSYIS